MIRCGVAGWDYRNWRGRVYPEREPKGFDRLEYLSHYLPVFEINRTYYRPATAAEARRWVQRVAHRKDAVLTAKLPERFVAPGRAWSEDDVKEARQGLDVIHDAGRLAGAILQFAYSFKRLRRDGSVDESAREWLRDALDAFPGLPLLVEFRHASWDAPEVLDELRARGVGWVNVDQPRLPRDALVLTDHATGPLGYLRMHGRNYQTWMRGQSRGTRKTAENVERRQAQTAQERAAEEAQKDARFDYLYTPEEVRGLADTLRRIAARPGVRDVLAVNNNHNEGKAPTNALMLAALLEGTEVAAPPELFRTYEYALKGWARPVPVAELRGQSRAAWIE